MLVLNLKCAVMLHLHDGAGDDDDDNDDNRARIDVIA